MAALTETEHSGKKTGDNVGEERRKGRRKRLKANRGGEGQATTTKALLGFRWRRATVADTGQSKPPRSRGEFKRAADYVKESS